MPHLPPDGARRPTLTARLAWVALGTLLLAVALEGALQAAAWWLRPPPPSDAPITILCEGDSFTRGLVGTSFPEQLEARLNERAGRRVFRAVNVAVSGANSALIADHLEAHLDEHRPAVVLVTTGENNSWNAVRLQGREGTLVGTIDRALDRSRLYRLVKAAVPAWSERSFHDGAPTLRELQDAANYLVDYGHADEGPPETPRPRSPERAAAYERGWELEDQLLYDQSLLVFLQLALEDPDDLDAYMGIATALSRMDRNPEGAAWLRHALDRPGITGNPQAWFELGMMLDLSGQHEAAERAWIDGLRHFPRSTRLFYSLSTSWFVRGVPVWDALDLRGEVPGLEDNDLFRYLDHLSRMTEGYASDDVRELVSDSMRRDLTSIVRTTRRRGVPLIFSSYPEHAYAEVEEVAAAHEVPYIDFRPIYARRFPDRATYISADGFHTNEVGNALMAEVFADRILEVLGPEALAAHGVATR